MAEWERWVSAIYDTARKLGFAPRDTEFLEASDSSIYQYAAYGFPHMYKHWSFGRDYFRLRSDAEQGNMRIYELVTNTHPAVAYLRTGNSLAENLFVIAHVAGHADFFDRNYLLRSVRKDFLYFLRDAEQRISQYEYDYGEDAVEKLIDLAHALQPHVSSEEVEQLPPRPTVGKMEDEGIFDVLRRSKSFQKLVEERNALEESWQIERDARRLGSLRTDLLQFLIEYAPLERWQRDVLSIVREVGLHIRPQRFTKLMNEGYAVFVCLRIMRELDVPYDIHWESSITHAKVSSGKTLSINPYWIGWRLFEYLDSKGVDVREVVESEYDLSFLRTHIDEEFVYEEKLFNWSVKTNDSYGRIESRDWKEVKNRIISQWSRLTEIPEVMVVRHPLAPSDVYLIPDKKLVEHEAEEITRSMSELWRGMVVLLNVEERPQKVLDYVAEIIRKGR